MVLQDLNEARCFALRHLAILLAAVVILRRRSLLLVRGELRRALLDELLVARPPSDGPEPSQHVFDEHEDLFLKKHRFADYAAIIEEAS